MDTDEFKELLRTKTAAEIVENHITTDSPGPFLVLDAIKAIENAARVRLQIAEEQSLKAVIVGSAKLGFSYIEKQGKDGVLKPAYRAFKPGDSDIDVAIVSPHAYGKLWYELAHRGSEQVRFPQESKLGDYMFHGWIRPDKFPNPPTSRCLDWNNVLHTLQKSNLFRYKKLRLALFHSKAFLNSYQQRGVRMAQEIEMIKP
jgi:predicted DNA-binding transcriptional regulator AlpA